MCSKAASRPGPSESQVGDRRRGARDRLVGLGAGLEPVPGRPLRGRPHPVRGQRLGQAALDGGHPEVRPEELVRRAEQHVDPELRPAHPPVGRQVHGVGPRERAGAMGGGGDAPGVGDRSERVGGEREGHHPGALPEQGLEARPRSRVPSAARIGARRTTSPWSAATSSQGDTLASWSRSVTTISSPGPRVRATACASRKFSVVMFAPKAISSGALPVRSAAAARASAITASDSSRGPERASQVGVGPAQVVRHRLDHHAPAPGTRPARRSRPRRRAARGTAGEPQPTSTTRGRAARGARSEGFRRRGSTATRWGCRSAPGPRTPPARRRPGWP